MIETPGATAIEPSATATTETVSATTAAAHDNDFSTFQAASRAAREGKPLAAVEVTERETPAGDKGAAKPLNRREREQQHINERIRSAVEEATKGLREEVERLRPGARTETVVPAKVEDAPAKEPEYKRFLKMAGAPKLDQFESVEEHAAAMAVFISDARDQERTTAARERDEKTSAVQALHTRYTAFNDRMQAAKTADPAFLDKLTPEIKDLHGYAEAERRGEQVSPRVFIGEQLYDSPIVATLLTHFSTEAGAAELRALEAMPEHLKGIRNPAERIAAHKHEIVRALAKIEARLESTAVPAGKSDATTEHRAGARDRQSQRETAPKSTITELEPPPTTLKKAGTTADTTEGAVKRNDFAKFQQLERQKREERVRRRA